MEYKSMREFVLNSAKEDYLKSDRTITLKTKVEEKDRLRLVVRSKLFKGIMDGLGRTETGKADIGIAIIMSDKYVDEHFDVDVSYEEYFQIVGSKQLFLVLQDDLEERK